MKKLSVAMLVAQFPNVVQTYILNTISGLQNNNTEVTVIASAKPKTVTALPESTQIPKKVIYINTHRSAFLKSFLTIPIFSFEYWTIVKQIFQSEIKTNFGWRYFVKSLVRAKTAVDNKYDVIHSHNLGLSYDYIFLKEIYHIPLVTTFHGKEPRSSKTLAVEKQKVVFEQGDIFLVNTQFAKNSLTEMGCPENKINILPQGTDTNSFPFKHRRIEISNDINVLTVGRLSIEKGQHIGLHAIKLLFAKYPTIKYHLVGDGPDRASLESLAHQLKLSDAVIFYGHVNVQELRAIYNTAHIFLLPSIDLKDDLHVETQGVVIQEAQSSGIPVIGSTSGGIPEIIIDNETGLLFSEGDEHDLARKIEHLIETTTMYKKLSENAIKDVRERFEFSRVSGKLLKHYELLTKHHCAPS